MDIIKYYARTHRINEFREICKQVIKRQGKVSKSTVRKLESYRLPFEAMKYEKIMPGLLDEILHKQASSLLDVLDGFLLFIKSNSLESLDLINKAFAECTQLEEECTQLMEKAREKLIAAGGTSGN